jgi:hypothetical protein
MEFLAMIRVHEMFHSFFRPRTGLAAIAQIEHEPRIVRCQPAELCGRHAGAAQENLDLSDQHGRLLFSGDSASRFVAAEILLVEEKSFV